MHHAWGYSDSVVFRVWEGDSTTRAGAGPKTSQECAWLHGNDSLLPLSVSVRMFFFFERATLRVGHPAPGCNNHKANATMADVDLRESKIGDRGAVALAGPVQALLATVFSCRPHSLFLRFGLNNRLNRFAYLSAPLDF